MEKDKNEQGQSQTVTPEHSVQSWILAQSCQSVEAATERLRTNLAIWATERSLTWPFDLSGMNKEQLLSLAGIIQYIENSVRLQLSDALRKTY